jgi:UDP-N-acetylmuramoyl-tripeptide--D-alanyl-D-alanine ligase
VDHVVIDSRQAGPSALFVALPGTRTDGHDHVDEAYQRGAAATLVSRHDGSGRSAIVVDDPGVALLRLAADERRRLSATVVGITGSVGKTTTKDLLASILGRRRHVTASPASYNNQIGLPLTVLAADRRSEVLVCEIGAGVVGEIASLCQVARPHVGVVTVVGKAHLASFGSVEAVAEGKVELVEGLPRAGTAVLNADDPVVRSYADRTDAQVLLFGRRPGADVRADRVRVREDGCLGFRLIHQANAANVELRLHGPHFLTDALAASACARTLGIPLEVCADALSHAEPSPRRMQERVTARGLRIWDDSYNANPTSVAAALAALAALPDRGRRIAVLGHMAELGRWSLREHERVGELAAAARLHRLVVVGPEARPIAIGAHRAGLRAKQVIGCASVDEALEAIRSSAEAGDIVLVKGSRVTGLDRLVDGLDIRVR